MMINLHLALSKLTPGSFGTKDPRKQGTHTAAKKSQQTHKVPGTSWGHMVPGWSGSVPVQFIFFNSYVQEHFLIRQKLSMGTQFHFEEDL